MIVEVVRFSYLEGYVPKTYYRVTATEYDLVSRLQFETSRKFLNMRRQKPLDAK